MTATIRLDIVSAEKDLFSGDCTMVIAPGVMGELGILPRHAPLVTRLIAGELRAKRADGSEDDFYVSGGILEVQPHIVTVLSNDGERAEGLDEALVLQAKAEAERLLSEKRGKSYDAEARDELTQAVAKLQALRRIRKQR